jgi:HK97 family phage major capsid protein
LAEAAEADDASPALAEPEIPNYKASAFVPWSVELGGDAIGLLEQLSRLMNDGMTQLLNVAFTTGSGVGNPTGLINALAGGSSVVNTATPATLTANDVYALQNSAYPRFQGNARWVANLAILNALRQMETSNGALKFPSLQSDSPTLLGRPVHELSNMDSTVAAGKHIAVYGDFSQYVITQRVGSSLELIPLLVGPNRRPTGQRGAWLGQVGRGLDQRCRVPDVAGLEDFRTVYSATPHVRGPLDGSGQRKERCPSTGRE